MGRLVLESVSKTFAGPAGTAPVAAVDRFSLEVQEGKLLVLLGPSGCGKTTLLRLIAGLDIPTSGRILLDGHSLEGVPPQKRPIGLAFQYPALLPQLTVRQNIALGPKLRGVSAAEGRARVEQLAELSRLTDLLERLPETLSGGQQQRVSLTRALANRPKLLLLDEPLANLDPISRFELREVIRLVQQELRLTTLYVTHDQTEAAAVCDEIALMHAGALQQAGTAQHLYGDPENLFAAEFFDPDRPNVFSATIRDGRLFPTGAAGDLPIEIRGNGKVTCVVRSRAITPGGPLQGRIHRIQHTGWSTRVVIDRSGLHLHCETSFAPHLKTGESLSFAIEERGFFLFDPATGARIRS
jgi:ABC-type sugar transport system ATPase subunit